MFSRYVLWTYKPKIVVVLPINFLAHLLLTRLLSSPIFFRLKIKQISANSEVGRNFHDHMNMPIYVSIQRPISITLSKVFTVSTVLEYYWKNTGEIILIDLQEHSTSLP